MKEMKVQRNKMKLSLIKNRSSQQDNVQQLYLHWLTNVSASNCPCDYVSAVLNATFPDQVLLLIQKQILFILVLIGLISTSKLREFVGFDNDSIVLNDDSEMEYYFDCDTLASSINHIMDASSHTPAPLFNCCATGAELYEFDTGLDMILMLWHQQEQ